MISLDTHNVKLLKARKRLRRLKLFYIHLLGYAIVVVLLLYNLYIVEGYYKDNIIALNLSVLFTWTLFIIMHAYRVFKEASVFGKKWEDEKIKEFVKEKTIEKQLWE